MNSNTTLVKVKSKPATFKIINKLDSNTTLVKVKSKPATFKIINKLDSNTTLVKVKCNLQSGESIKRIKFKYNSC